MTSSLKRFITTSLLLIWMGVIFAFSEQPGSGSNWQPPLWYVLERKSAHVFEYAVLFVLTASTLRVWLLRLSRIHIFAMALVLVVSYGISDEIHQAFVFGRGSRFTDVLIDTGGALVGMMLLFATERFRLSKR